MPVVSRVSVIGLGYVGLPVAALLAAAGHRVLGCDINPAVVEAVQAGRSHFQEPDLEMLLQAAVGSGRLTAALTPQPADYHLLCVPTPITADHRPDLSHLAAATRALAPVLTPGCCVILESTCPVGATERLAAELAALRPDLRLPVLGREEPVDVHIAHCPERVLPGRTVQELIGNERVIGGMTAACARLADQLYASFATGARHLTDCRTAEFVKLAENAFRDVNIAFANELSLLAERLGLDVWRAIALANRHPRVAILRPGAGVGGHCIAVDPWFLADAAPDAAPLIRTARAVNDAKPRRVAAQLSALAAAAPDRPIALLGLTYKPDVDDLRESPALLIAELLAAEGRELLIAEPHLPQLPPALRHCRHLPAEAALQAAGTVGVLVAHSAFRSLPRSAFAGRGVVDAAGLLAA
ncbi:MAG: UDP-N-acetyl-D-mannosamine dehydrogenase [Rhodovarius sp.]|nr:UDP-N-acetyl-D-mannosamine dehydrogenase [Rhodovarius sp.]